MNVVITGGTKGMGRAIAEAFGKEGANLALTARNQEDLIKLKETLALAYPSIQILIHPTDLAIPEEVKAFANKISKTWDKVDILINNAGLFLTGNMMEEDEDYLQKMLQVNLIAVVQLTRQLAPALMKSNAAQVFNICSVASQKFFPGSGSYSVSKYALLGFTRALREEWRSKNIKVTAVLPGATWSRSWEGSDIDPMRLMQAADVAQAILAASKLPATALMEEIVLRPPLGDL